MNNRLYSMTVEYRKIKQKKMLTYGTKAVLAN